MIAAAWARDGLGWPPVRDSNGGRLDPTLSDPAPVVSPAVIHRLGAGPCSALHADEQDRTDQRSTQGVRAWWMGDIAADR